MFKRRHTANALNHASARQKITRKKGNGGVRAALSGASAVRYSMATNRSLAKTAGIVAIESVRRLNRV
jgi:hypothetical protein